MDSVVNCELGMMIVFSSFKYYTTFLVPSQFVNRNGYVIFDEVSFIHLSPRWGFVRVEVFFLYTYRPVGTVGTPKSNS